MRRLLAVLSAVGLGSLGATAVAQAQGPRFGIGGGLVAPTSAYGDLDKAGWHALGKVEFKVPMSPVGLRVDGMYGQTSHDALFSPDGNTKFVGALANVVLNVPVAVPMVKPYVLAGGGVYNMKIKAPSQGIDDSETKFTWGAGAGLSLGAGLVNFFVEGRYLSVQTSGSSLKFLPLTVGVTFGSK